MVELINTIKTSFIYIIGILFFIFALYVTLIPPNCNIMKNRKNIIEAFVSNSKPKNYLTVVNNKSIGISRITDSISAYKEIIGQNLDSVNVYDSYLELNKDIIPDRQSNKLLILSRCYQMPLQSPFLEALNKNFNPRLFGSYAEMYTFSNVNDFGTDILNNCIMTSVTAFYKSLNIDTNAKTSISNKIKGTVYVLIEQNPYYYDTNTNSTLHINPSMISQTQGASKNIYYAPLYSAPISNASINEDATNKPSSTPEVSSIAYKIYIIYDQYFSGPNNTYNGSEPQEIPVNSKQSFSKSQYNSKNTSISAFSKSYLDNMSLSSATQCYIGAMGPGGMQYIGGCASHSGVGTHKTVCSSPIQGDDKQWSYLVLYTVNKSDLIENYI